MTEKEVEGVDYHWGPHPAWGYLTKHVGGSRKDCSGPDCGIEEWEIPPGMRNCPTCGPTGVEWHPRKFGILRCVNCKEHL